MYTFYIFFLINTGLSGLCLVLEMKCLLCSYKSDDQKKLIEHYLTYYNIDSKNWFFRKLFQSNSGLHLKNCVRCKEFLPTKKEKIQHDFLKHYNDGKEIPFEERPLDIIRYPALTIYQIEYMKYSNLYPFYDSEKCVNECLLNVKQRFHVTNSKWFKCSFTIENQQSPINSNHEPLKDIRY